MPQFTTSLLFLTSYLFIYLLLSIEALVLSFHIPMKFYLFRFSLKSKGSVCHSLLSIFFCSYLSHLKFSVIYITTFTLLLNVATIVYPVFQISLNTEVPVCHSLLLIFSLDVFLSPLFSVVCIVTLIFF